MKFALALAVFAAAASARTSPRGSADPVAIERDGLEVRAEALVKKDAEPIVVKKDAEPIVVKKDAEPEPEAAKRDDPPPVEAKPGCCRNW
jgi:hypothetical protein